MVDLGVNDTYAHRSLIRICTLITFGPQARCGRNLVWGIQRWSETGRSGLTVDEIKRAKIGIKMLHGVQYSVYADGEEADQT